MQWNYSLLREKKVWAWCLNARHLKNLSQLRFLIKQSGKSSEVRPISSPSSQPLDRIHWRPGSLGTGFSVCAFVLMGLSWSSSYQKNSHSKYIYYIAQCKIGKSETRQNVCEKSWQYLKSFSVRLIMSKWIWVYLPLL